MSRRAALAGQLTLGGTGPSWTPQQEAIFAHRGPLCVDAKAGCGKTTTAAESGGRKLSKGDVAMFAFNLTARDDLAKKVARGVFVATLGSLGFRVVQKSFPKALFLKKGRVELIVKQVCDAGEAQPLRFRQAAVDIVDKARETLAPLDTAGMLGVMDRFDIDWSNGAILTEDQRAEGRQRLAALSLAVLQRCREDVSAFDFPDQVWLPHVLNLPRHRSWSALFVDEGQDLNDGQIKLIERVAGNDTEVTIIGDPAQAIYAFRGASAVAFARLSETFGCKRLPLSVTFRCGQRIVELARNIVPDFSAAPSNPEGAISDIDTRDVLAVASPGDFILSRSNAPLLKYCLEAIRVGKPAGILGRDVLRDLTLFLQGAEEYLGSNPSKSTFLRWLGQWEEAEVGARVMDKRDTAPVSDKADCMRALWDHAATLDEARDRLHRIYVDEKTGVPRQRITLSTTHKAKGLEADRVIVLEGTYNVGRAIEEDNLYYVAITRAKRHLFLANKDREPARWTRSLRGRFG